MDSKKHSKKRASALGHKARSEWTESNTSSKSDTPKNRFKANSKRNCSKKEKTCWIIASDERLD
eukprot:Awhi_evm1s11259